MNREIKFRAWDKTLNCMITVRNINDLIDSNLNIMQYTGLKDRNDEEIYEGDIVEISDFIYSIKFEIGSFMLVRCSDETDMYTAFDNCWNDDVYPLCQLHWESGADEDVLYYCEVIGNIYENPELLER